MASYTIGDVILRFGETPELSDNVFTFEDIFTLYDESMDIIFTSVSALDEYEILNGLECYDSITIEDLYEFYQDVYSEPFEDITAEDIYLTDIGCIEFDDIYSDDLSIADYVIDIYDDISSTDEYELYIEHSAYDDITSTDDVEATYDIEMLWYEYPYSDDMLIWLDITEDDIDDITISEEYELASDILLYDDIAYIDDISTEIPDLYAVDDISCVEDVTWFTEEILIYLTPYDDISVEDIISNDNDASYQENDLISNTEEYYIDVTDVEYDNIGYVDEYDALYASLLDDLYDIIATDDYIDQAIDLSLYDDIGTLDVAYEPSTFSEDVYTPYDDIANADVWTFDITDVESSDIIVTDDISAIYDTYLSDISDIIPTDEYTEWDLHTLTADEEEYSEYDLTYIIDEIQLLSELEIYDYIASIDYEPTLLYEEEQPWYSEREWIYISELAFIDWQWDVPWTDTVGHYERHDLTWTSDAYELVNDLPLDNNKDWVEVVDVAYDLEIAYVYDNIENITVDEYIGLDSTCDLCDDIQATDGLLTLTEAEFFDDITIEEDAVYADNYYISSEDIISTDFDILEAIEDVESDIISVLESQNFDVSISEISDDIYIEDFVETGFSYDAFETISISEYDLIDIGIIHGDNISIVEMPVAGNLYSEIEQYITVTEYQLISLKAYNPIRFTAKRYSIHITMNASSQDVLW